MLGRNEVHIPSPIWAPVHSGDTGRNNVAYKSLWYHVGYRLGRFFASVRQKMSNQSCFPDVSLGTATALERPLSLVGLKMAGEVALLREDDGAEMTPEGPLTLVHANVHHKMAPLREGAGTQVARVPPLTRVAT